MTLQPNFERFRTAVLSQGEPDRVPLAEASIDTGIKQAVLGRPIRTARDEADGLVKAAGGIGCLTGILERKPGA